MLPAFAPASRVNGEATLSPSLCDLISAANVWAISCSSLWEFNHSRNHFQLETDRNQCKNSTSSSKSSPLGYRASVWGIAASFSAWTGSYQPRPGLLPTAGHHLQFHFYSNCHENNIYPVYYQCGQGQSASSRLLFQGSPVHGGGKLHSEQGVPVVLDPVHSIRLFGGILSSHPPWDHSYCFSSLGGSPESSPVVIRFQLGRGGWLYIWLVVHMLFRFLGLPLEEGEVLNQEEEQLWFINIF